jgi:adenylosuccinate lyase
MRRIFEEETLVQKMLDVEAALAWAHAEVGNIPRKDAEKIAAMASTKYVKLSRIKEIEREIKHDIASMVRALAEVCGTSGAYVHLGATSSDVKDTATALQLKEALELIDKKLAELQETLRQKALQVKGPATIGIATNVPASLTLKFSAWMQEISRHIERLRECKERILVGKMSGAVGTQAGLGIHALKIQKLVMKRLGIKVADISTQILQRDRHAEVVCLLAIIAASLEKFATVVPELQRSEDGEFSETRKQVDNSRMLHEEKLEICKRICGLARIVRSLVIPALENVTTWHERDLTQSSAERFIIPQACILVDYMLFMIIKIFMDLQVDVDQRIDFIDSAKLLGTSYN